MKKDDEKVTTSETHLEAQGLLNLKPLKEVEIDGIGMGVLSDGTPYLTARGLARMCGIDHTLILELANKWEAEQFKPRGIKISNLLSDQGFLGGPIALKVKQNGQTTHAFTDAVCMAVLEYYAFEAGQNIRE